MALPTDGTSQWNKRTSTDALLEAPAAKRRRADGTQTCAGPVMAPRGPAVSPFGVLPNDVIHQLLQQMKGSTRRSLAICSRSWAETLRRFRWDDAGALVENGVIRELATDDGWIQFNRTEMKFSGLTVARFHFQIGDLSTLPRKARLSDHEIGFRLGCRRTHVVIQSEATPELMAGLAAASGWKSLSLAIDLATQDLPALLNPLIDGQAQHAATLSRELALTMGSQRHGSLQKPRATTVPPALENGRLELVSLTLLRSQSLTEALSQFGCGHSVRHLAIHTDSQTAAADALGAIGPRFPRLQNLSVTSSERCWAPGESWRTFLQEHKELQMFSLRFEGVPSPEFQMDFSLLKVRRFDLKMRCFSDPQGELASWVRENQQLEEFNLQAASLAQDHWHDLQGLAQAVAENRSIRKLSVMGFAGDISGCATESREKMYRPEFIDLLEPISGNAYLKELALPWDLSEIAESKDLPESRLLSHLERLERLNPGLTLATLNDIFGPHAAKVSHTLQVPADVFIARFGWREARPHPGPEEFVKLQVEMPTWGQGAFRALVEFTSSQPEAKDKLVWERLLNGELKPASFRIVDMVGRPG